MSSESQGEFLKYKRSRFTARLPLDRLYTPSHFWVQQQPDGTHRVGFTRFAKRMLGDIVELDFEVEPGSAVQLGQIIGWVEAFKAVADIYCVGTGTFLEANPAVASNPELIDKDPHGDGWLYRVEGDVDGEAVDAHGYAALLDEKIDQMLGDDRYAQMAAGDEIDDDEEAEESC